MKLALTLCEERGLSVSQNRTLGIKFGSNCKRDEVEKRHNDERHSLYTETMLLGQLNQAG